MSLKIPNASVERGAYSAIVYIDGDLCVAEDNVGNIISEQAKSDYVADVIQDAADAIDTGAIFVKNADEDYLIKSGVSWMGGISFISDGATLDLSNLNNTFLTIGTDGVESLRERTDISGFSVKGDHLNDNTLFLKASNLQRALTVSNISHYRINNMIEVRGESYLATIDKVTGMYCGGTWIKFVGLAGAGNVPFGAIVSNCENSNGYYEDGLGIGIQILVSADDSPLSIKISKCWIEAMATGIYTEANSIVIDHSLISCKDYGILLHKSASYSSAGESIITGNEIHVDDTAGIGIDLAGDAWRQHIITSNFFYSIHGVGIRNSKENYGVINNNYFSLNVAAAIGIGQAGTGYLRQTIINGNRFYGAATPRGTAIAAYITKSAITTNVFDQVTYWLNHANIHYSNIQGNVINLVTNGPTVGSGCIIRNNYGYVTENDGTSSGTGAQQTVAHGLDTTPTIVMVGDIEQNAAPYQSAAANATNIYITAGNGLDWWWKAEV